jgi:hypothetical protein
MGKFSKNERVTEGQLNQNPQLTSDIEFNRPLMMKAVVPYQQLPRQGPCSQFWDFAFSQKKGRDYTTGASVIWAEEDELGPDEVKTGNKRITGYVRKIVRDRFNHLTLAQAIVQLAQEERPFIIGIEDAAGSRFLEPTIMSEAYKTKDSYIIELCSHIDWVAPDNQTDAKRVRMRAMYPWIAEGRFKFLNACMSPKDPTLESFYSEWEKCLTSHHHDDIPDVISQQPRYAPQSTQIIVNHIEDKMTNFDRMGWSEVFDENYQPNIGAAYTLDDNGMMVPLYPTPESTELFVPESDAPSHTPNGMQNILGVGMNG